MLSKNNELKIPQEIWHLISGEDEYEKILPFDGVKDTLCYSNAQLRGYLREYFPRSFYEAYYFFYSLQKYSQKYKKILSNKHHLRILDIGSGIGGNLCGIIHCIREKFPEKSFYVHAIDGNAKALGKLKEIFERLSFHSVELNCEENTFTPNTLISDLKRLTKDKPPYDIIMCHKFINEFYRKVNVSGLYSDIITFSHDVLRHDGILMITELTDKDIKNNYLNKTFCQETRNYFQSNINLFKQIYPHSCYLWRGQCEEGVECYIQDVFSVFLGKNFKAFTQIFCFRELGNDFYDAEYFESWKAAPIRIKNTGNKSNSFCYLGKLYDDSDLSENDVLNKESGKNKDYYHKRLVTRFIYNIKSFIHFALADPNLDPVMISKRILISLNYNKNNNSEREVFRNYIVENKIEYLIHFTKIINIEKILTYGLIPRKYLELEAIKIAIMPEFADDRTHIDKAHNLLSISFPDFQDFHKLNKNDKSLWAVFLIDSQIIIDHECGFEKEPSSNGFDFSKGIKAADDLFDNPMLRETLKLPKWYTTNPKSVVLEFSVIPPLFIKEIHLYSEKYLYKLIDLTRNHNIKVVVDRRLFEERNDSYYWKSL